MPRHARLPLWNNRSPEQKLETLRDLVLDLYRYQFGAALAALSDMLAAHAAADAKEARDIALIRELMARHPNIISMNCEVGHFTASAIIVDLPQRRALLHFHKRLNRWLQVGGHAEYETDFALVALREAREETGLRDLAFFPERQKPAPVDIDVHTIPERRDVPAHLHLDLRYLLVTRQPDALMPAVGESTRFRWLSFPEALAMEDEIDAPLRRLLRKAAALLGGSGNL